MNDLISRQDALKIVEDYIDGSFAWGAMMLKLKRLPSAQQWIPCSERLPKEDGRYLCTYKDIFYGDKNFIDFGLFDDGQWIVEPLAWMPLPQPWEIDGDT